MFWAWIQRIEEEGKPHAEQEQGGLQAVPHQPHSEFNLEEIFDQIGTNFPQDFPTIMDQDLDLLYCDE